MKVQASGATGYGSVCSTQASSGVVLVQSQRRKQSQKNSVVNHRGWRGTPVPFSPPSLAVNVIRTRQVRLGRCAPPSKSKENNTSKQQKERQQSHARHCRTRRCMHAIGVCLLHASILFCCSNVKTWSDIYQSRRAAPASPTRALAILCLRASCVRSRRTTPRQKQVHRQRLRRRRRRRAYQ
jgi:hypothetical protein